MLLSSGIDVDVVFGVVVGVVVARISQPST